MHGALLLPSDCTNSVGLPVTPLRSTIAGGRDVLSASPRLRSNSRSDVIVTYGAAVAALKQATASIPIVLIANDPVGSGLVASLSRPGGNQMQMERFNG